MKQYGVMVSRHNLLQALQITGKRFENKILSAVTGLVFKRLTSYCSNSYSTTINAL